ncbi:MAG: hypothetical protein SPL73_08175 [Cyanobacteriota bacterium]|nr:hypothetical protein [Cyanobacteriota bacterium]MDY6359099.1 hypothetical protein [Cyanobacteriota bacterium]MDY6364846.1 hypothetical protein [Cyanobacteriota bacterium]MDY6383238.1 hypothetical protein [Cyanobacteriota bacterium]
MIKNTKNIQKLGMTKLTKIFASILCFFLTSIPAMAAKATGAGAPSGKELVSKFGMAMAGVMVFSFVIYLGLSVYNKFFVEEQIKDFKLRKDSLRTPTDKDEAVMMYIAKNRLR